MAKTLGIDLGTTNTSVAIDGEIRALARQPAGLTILPSVVAFPPTGATLIGAPARRRRAIDPKNTIFSSKRIIGCGGNSRELQEFRDRYPFELAQTSTHEAAFTTRAGVRTPVDIAAIILGEARKQLGDDANDANVVVGVPSAFGSAQRSATLDAVRRAGWSQVSVIDEPVATAWAYFCLGNPGYRYAAVYDLGGGTFDFAVLDCEKDPFTVLAHDGDSYLGGDDVDHALASWAANEMLRLHNWDVRNDPEALDRLTVECERAKIRLAHAAQTVIELGEVDPAAPVAADAIQLNVGQLEALCAPLLQKTFAICDAALRRSNLRARDIGAVFLAGGSSQLPMIRAGLKEYFGTQPRREFDPMEVLAIGASLKR